MKQVYRHVWRNNPRRAELRGRHCTILAVGRMNTVMVRWETGGFDLVDRQALRKI